MLERAADQGCRSYFYLGSPIPPMPALNMQWFACKDASNMLGALWKKCGFAPKFLVFRPGYTAGKKEFENRVQVDFVRKKLNPHENNTPAFH